ncbi:hypothetical protein TR51_06500 [Kitasatospora griseola]|uniref:Uncharacterized protein n=1 Tax=Kitasatospora griseola TaxID=2064 RepID=A0A0D0PX89_KITGR|nr:hypothetical protein [Kitasatospora griseola]KIQ67034.1 hypothetical protein TR51_06500 [Kitasatospora griseola]
MTLDPTAYLVGDLIANAIADLADAPSRISEFLDGEDDTPAPGPERDALITEITTRLSRIADANLAELLSTAGQEG